MPAPAAYLSLGLVQPVEVAADYLIEMHIDFGLEFLACLAVGTGRGHLEHRSQLGKELVQCALQRHFVPTQNQDHDPHKRYYPRAGEILSALAKALAGFCRTQYLL